jgi:hypothetical protein
VSSTGIEYDILKHHLLPKTVLVKCVEFLDKVESAYWSAHYAWGLTPTAGVKRDDSKLEKGLSELLSKWSQDESSLREYTPKMQEAAAVLMRGRSTATACGPVLTVEATRHGAPCRLSISRAQLVLLKAVWTFVSDDDSNSKVVGDMIAELSKLVGAKLLTQQSVAWFLNNHFVNRLVGEYDPPSGSRDAKSNPHFNLVPLIPLHRSCPDLTFPLQKSMMVTLNPSSLCCLLPKAWVNDAVISWFMTKFYCDSLQSESDLRSVLILPSAILNYLAWELPKRLKNVLIWLIRD